MAGKNIFSYHILFMHVSVIMAKNKFPQRQFSRVKCDSNVFIPLIFQNIMIAFNKLNGKGREITSPPAEQFHLLIAFTVKHIANDDQLFRLKKLNQVNQALHIFLKNRLGHANARLTEMPCFTQVQIGKDK